MNNAPIFIVGSQRSGTTLLAAFLGAHSRLSCGPETHFFRRLAEIDPNQLIAPASWPDQAIEFIHSITHANYFSDDRTPLLDKYGLAEIEVREYLQQKEPSIPNILSSVTELYMVKNEKKRWVAKTPDHLNEVYSIRQYFPNSPVIRIIRDPRDVALSLTKVPWGASTIIEALHYWRRLDDNSKAFFESDSLSYTIHYENLVSDPREALRGICQFIDEQYEEQMLDTSESGEQLNTRNVPWKDKARRPIDPSRVFIWKKKMSKQEKILAEAVLGDRIEAYQYEREKTFSRYVELIPSPDLAFKYVEAITEMAASGVRFWSISEDEKPELRIFLGDPGVVNWQAGEGSKGLFQFLLFSFTLLISRLSNQPVYWISEYERDQWTGVYAYLLKKLMLPYKPLQA